MASKKKKPAASRKVVRTSTPADKIRLPDSSAARKAGSASSGGKQEEKLTGEERYYRLNKQAVEDLVTASEENSPEVPTAELRKYHAVPRFRMADWLKVILIKAWFAGVICYFFIWGLSTYSLNQIDHLVIIGLALGMVTNLLTNNVLRFIAKTPGAYDRWMMVPNKKIWFLPLDLIYALVLVLCVLMTYNLINTAAAQITGNTESIFLGVEPILFGIFIMGWDLLFVSMKRLLMRIISDAKRNTK